MIVGVGHSSPRIAGPSDTKMLPVPKWRRERKGAVGMTTRQAMFRLATIASGAIAAALLPTSAFAADCGTSGIGARFSEAARFCTGSAVPAPATTDRPVAIAPVAVRETASVSVSMPGYQRRLAAAVQQVKRRGGSAAPDALVVAIGRKYRIDPHLLASMVSAESGGNMRAVSHKGALGLMQVMPATARSLGVSNPDALLTDRTLALSTGAAYLKKLQGQFGNNVPLVVAAYNAGPGAVVKYKGVPRYRETQGYVRTVMGRYAAARGVVVGAAQ
jgi:soluble lytic murein transglycosylase-like protein